MSDLNVATLVLVSKDSFTNTKQRDLEFSNKTHNLNPSLVHSVLVQLIESASAKKARTEPNSPLTAEEKKSNKTWFNCTFLDASGIPLVRADKHLGTCIGAAEMAESFPTIFVESTEHPDKIQILAKTLDETESGAIRWTFPAFGLGKKDGKGVSGKVIFAVTAAPVVEKEPETTVPQ